MNRRRFIKTTGAGALLLNPFINQLYAAEKSPRPIRVVFFLQTNGMYREQIQPPGIKRTKRPEKLEDLTLEKAGFHRSLEPLAPFKDRMTYIHGLSGRIAGGGHSNDFGALGCYPSRNGILGETIDAALAKKLPSIFSHVGLGAVDKDKTVVYNVSSWKAGQKMPTQCIPELAYNGLFGVAAGKNGRKEFDAKTHLLDYMAADVKKVQKQLNSFEKEKLDHYLNSFETMSSRQAKLAAKAEAIRNAAPKTNEKYLSKSHWLDRMESQFEIAAGALIAGLTNVVTLSSCSGNAYFGSKFNGLQVGLTDFEIGQHGIGHGGGAGGKTAAEINIELRRKHMKMLAGFMKTLQSVPEGDGTMLDNTFIVYTSDSAEQHHSRCYEWPVILFGDMSGRLKTGNRYIQFPDYGKNGHRTLANFYTSLLHAAGDKRKRFGMPDLALKDLNQDGPLAEIML